MVAQDAHDPHGHDSHAIHAHAAPTGFIRKYIFSLDHKVIGLQYYFLALTRGVRRHVPVAADAHPHDLADGRICR